MTYSTNDPAGYGTWDYRDSAFVQDRDLGGYDVEATDGSIGKIDETSNEAGASHVVVDTVFTSQVNTVDDWATMPDKLAPVLEAI